MYHELRLDLVIETLATLRNRISERFPESGLSKVANELHEIAMSTGPTIESIRKPNMLVRAGVAFALGLITTLSGVVLLYALKAGPVKSDLGEMLQTLESAAQSLIFFSLGIYFLVTIETRLHRRKSLRELRRLRSIVHIVDMHQLTKDPESIRNPNMGTPSSPRRELTPYELVRYLDYSTELLSLASKLAALHVQYVNDPVVLDAVNDIEVLASNLSNLMWQKIVLIDREAVEA